MGGLPLKLLHWGRDGGPESSVDGFWLVEIKRLLSVVLLRFQGRSREAFHTHAFNSISWVLKGELVEHFADGKGRTHRPSLKPIITKRSTFHKVDSDGTTIVFSLRGPWAPLWWEHRPDEGYVPLTHGRKELDEPRY